MYDVFISFKNLDGASVTPDSKMAEELHGALLSSGVSVFYSNFSIAEQGTSDYKSHIDSALVQAKILIVVGTKREYVESPWVKYEWDTFSQEILSGRKVGSELFTYIREMSVSDLPIGIRNRQSFSAESSVDDIVQHVKKALVNNGARKGTDLDDINGGISAYYGIGQDYDYRKAMSILREYPEVSIANYLIGQMYYYGNGVEKNYKTACNYFNAAREQDNILATYKLANCYKKERGVDLDFDKYERLIKEATTRYVEKIKGCTDSEREYVNNLVYLGMDKGVITREAMLASEIYLLLKNFGVEIELFDIGSDDCNGINRVDEIRDEKTMFIFSSIGHIQNKNMKEVWEKMFSQQTVKRMSAVYLSGVKIHDLPSNLKGQLFIERDENSIKKIINFYRGGNNATQ